MKNWKNITLAGLGLIGSGVGLVFWSAASQWNKETKEIVEKLKENAVAENKEKVSFESLEELPAPVRKYFNLVLKEGQTFIKTARFTQKGEFFLNENWIPFEAEQYFSANPASFVWDADMRMNPVLNVRIRDTLADGQASMKAKILSLVSVVDMNGEKEILSSALQRYLAEAVWLPTTLLPSDKLSWSEIDENRALATLNESGTTVSLEFRFNEKGEVTEVFSSARFREVEGKFVPTPWLGRFSKYEQQNGILIPTEGEVEWQLTNGNVPYWRGQITSAEYEFETPHK